MLPWDAINKFLLKCGAVRDPYAFAQEVLNQIGLLIPFDEGRLYYLDDNGDMFDEYLIGVDKQTVLDYKTYYSHPSQSDYATSIRASRFTERYPSVEECVHDQNWYGDDEFYSGYVKPHGIKSSFGLGLRDTRGRLKCLMSLDRTRDEPYSKHDIEVMKVIRPHLDDLYQNFYVQPNDGPVFQGGAFENETLTRREVEIAELLLSGVNPQGIARKLCISITTVNKHIANMHAKLHVSTQQELMIKLMHIMTPIRYGQ